MANRIASAPFSIPFGSPLILVPVFSGLNLGPGTYYLTIAADAGCSIGWAVTDTPSITTDLGAALNPGTACFKGTSPAPYPPASGTCPVSFPGISDTNNLLFSVISGASVPEPNALSMLLAAGLIGSGEN